MTHTPALGRREARKARTREALLTSAMNLISRQGIYVTTVEEVTDAAGVAKGTFYEYFADKDELLATLLRHGLNRLLVISQQSAESAAGPQALEAIVRAHVEFLLRQPPFVLLFHQVRGLLQLPQPVSAELRCVYGAYLQALAALIDRFTTKRRRSGERALLLSAFSTGLVNHYRLFSRRLELKLDVDALTAQILAGIG